MRCVRAVVHAIAGAAALLVLAVMWSVSAGSRTSALGRRSESVWDVRNSAPAVRAGRHLLDTVQEPYITVVRNGREFQAAVEAGAQDILIKDHLDLSAVPLALAINTARDQASDRELTVLGDIKPSTRSIRGDCRTKPTPTALGLPASDLGLWKAPQCVIVNDHTIFLVFSRLWLNALYLRLLPSSYYLNIGVHLYQGGEVYGTDLAMQGTDPGQNCSALRLAGKGKAYIADSSFDSLGLASQVWLRGSSAVLQNCSFSNIEQLPRRRSFDEDAQQFTEDGVISVTDNSSSIRVQDSKFTDVAATSLFWSNGGQVVVDGLTYRNVTTADVQWDASGTVVVPGNGELIVRELDTSQVAAGSLDAPGSVQQVAPLKPDDAWLTAVKQALAGATPAQQQDAPDPPPNPALTDLDAVGIAADAAPRVRAVNTREEFKDAFHAGDEDIEIRDHLDLRGLDLTANPVVEVKPEYNGGYAFGVVGPDTRSIRGRCSEPPGSAFTPEALGLGPDANEPWVPPRCVLVTKTDLFIVDQSRLWLDSLHIQIVNGDRTATLSTGPVALWAAYAGQMYVTNTVVQGNGHNESESTCLQVDRSVKGVFARGSVFNACQGEADHGIAILARNSLSYFKSCAFKRLSGVVAPANSDGRWPEVFGAIQVTGANSTVVLDNCTFSDVKNPNAVVVSRGAVVYSNDPQQTTLQGKSYAEIPPRPLAALADRSSRAKQPLQDDDLWFVTAQKTLAQLPRSAYLPNRGRPPPDSDAVTPGTEPGADGLLPTAPGSEDTSASAGDDGNGSDSSNGVVIGVAAAVIALLLLCTGAVVFAFLKRRKKSRGDAAAAGPSAFAHAQDGSSYPLSASGSSWKPRAGRVPPGYYDASAFGGPGLQAGAPPPAGSWHDSSSLRLASPGGQYSMHVGSAATATVTNITKRTWSSFQKAGGEAKSPVGELEAALDGMFETKATFCGRYTLGSDVERRAGGQGVVQFADIAGTRDRAAIKFYIHREAFEKERELYTESKLRSMMPATLDVEDNASGTHQTPYGYVFPPFVIIECGQSLDEWARENANTDFITVFQALSHAVRALRRLHSVGYAHRDIKPGNILRRPKQHDWTLIDFGCTAPIGSTAGIMFSLKYAAPEVVQALRAGHKTLVVDAAADMWAIGVIAFELLTGERAFPSSAMNAAETDAAVQSALCGDSPLPWEGEGKVVEERLEKLRGLRRTVLRCLDRDPALRPTAEALLRSWDHTFDNIQTHGTTWTADGV